MILTTTNSIEGHTIQDYLGIVSGVCLNYQRPQLTFNMEKYYGSLESQLEVFKEEAFQKLVTNATNLKANAVVGISVDVESTASGATIVSIVGTAVKVI